MSPPFDFGQPSQPAVKINTRFRIGLGLIGSTQEECDAALRKMHAEGLNDRQIADIAHSDPSNIYQWRTTRGLSANLVQGRNGRAIEGVMSTPEIKDRCLRLLRKGIGPRVISRELSVSLKSLEKWRTAMLRDQPELRRASPGRPVPRTASGRKYRVFRPERRLRAFELYAEGLDDAEIGAAIDMPKRRVWEWRAALRLPANKPQGGRVGAITDKPKKRPTPPAITPYSNPLYARIASAVGHYLAPDIREDAISEIWLAMEEGKISVDRIEGEARRYSNRVVGSFASRFQPRSLDEDITGDGFRLIDTIADDRASSWLEEMGATVW